MTVQQLHRRWVWTTAAAIVLFAILLAIDSLLTHATGFGTRALQLTASGSVINDIVAHWYAPQNALLAGFSLGFDYLFMPLYAFAFFYSGLIVRERFAPKPGATRRILQLIAAIPLAGGIADALENALELRMVTAGGDDQLATLAFTATNAKMLCFYVGLALLVGAFIARLGRPRADPA